MKHIKLYSILFEADSTSLVDPTDIAKAVADGLKPEFEKLDNGFKEIGDRFEKQTKQVPTNSLSTSGAKPAVGSKESGTEKKVDDLTKIAKAIQTAGETSGETIDAIKSQVSSLTDMATKATKS